MSTILKVCNTCLIEKSLGCYTANKRYKHGTENKCKECFKTYLSDKKDKLKESQRKWREKNPDYMKEYAQTEKNKEYHQKYYVEHSQEYKDRKKEWRAKNPDRETATRIKYTHENRYKINEYHREWKADKREADVKYKLKDNISRRLRYELCSNLNGKKTKRTLQYLGCTLENLKSCLESKFSGLMSWDNYGSLWHIDHIIPCAAWDLTNDFDNMCCWNYRNLQPLLSKENQSKRDKYDIKDKEEYVALMKTIIV